MGTNDQACSLSSSYYFIVFIYDATRKLWIYFLKLKSSVFDVFKKWRALVENKILLRLKCLRFDNGGEYYSKELEKFYALNEIKNEKIVL